jgi:hypothetical protein
MNVTAVNSNQAYWDRTAENYDRIFSEKWKSRKYVLWKAINYSFAGLERNMFYLPVCNCHLSKAFITPAGNRRNHSF